MEADFERAFRCNRGANQSASVGDHEIDCFGGGPFGGHDQVAFILPAFIISKNDHFTCCESGDQFINGIEHCTITPEITLVISVI